MRAKSAQIFKKVKSHKQRTENKDLKTPLAIKVGLLFAGLHVPQGIVDQVAQMRGGWNPGRKGGAGPAGGRYFILLEPFSSKRAIINVPLQSPRAQSSPFVVQSVEADIWTITFKGEVACKLKLLPPPRFALQKVENHLASKYALLHGVDCLATTIRQSCIYWRTGQACRYCGIELSLAAGDTIEVKDPNHLVQVLGLALAEVPVTHVTLTIGTQQDESRGIRDYLPVIQALKATHPGIKVHAQFEPLRQLEYIHRLRATGCDTAGIHVDVISDKRRHEYCPGKSYLRWADYLRAWQTAVDAFGKNQVDSFILLGLEPLNPPMLKRVREMCAIGVLPYPVPVRVIPGTCFKLLDLSLEALILVHRTIARMIKRAKLNPTASLAGCVRCTACSAITEAMQEL